MMRKPICKLKSFDLKGSTVLVRADLNVPLRQGTIVDDFKLQSMQPTLDYILEQSATIILVTHIGRPTQPTPELSTQHLLPWFTKKGYRITFAETIDRAKILSKTNPREIILLENIRFFPQEKNHDPLFAQQLHALAQYYVNDAFGLAHRSDTSITLVPQLFGADKKSIGFLIEKELTMLSPLLTAPQHPFVSINGGGKVHDKLPLLFNMLSHIDELLLCPAISFTFAKMKGQPVGNSLVEDAVLDQAKSIESQAKTKGILIKLPVDYLYGQGSFKGPLAETDIQHFPKDGVGISLGQKTIEEYVHIIQQAKTIFFNGLSGSLDRPETLGPVKALFKAMQQAKAYSVIAGGDSVGAARLLRTTEGISFLSTGGGATLAFLAGQPLPGLEYL